jgi:hypothetical protein
VPAPWDDEYVAPANMFANGALPGEAPIATDYTVPECTEGVFF